nr:hypothetical protein EATA8330_31370 [Enterobacter asburiae]
MSSQVKLKNEKILLALIFLILYHLPILMLKVRKQPR